MSGKTGRATAGAGTVVRPALPVIRVRGVIAQGNGHGHAVSNGASFGRADGGAVMPVKAGCRSGGEDGGAAAHQGGSPASLRRYTTAQFPTGPAPFGMPGGLAGA